MELGKLILRTGKSTLEHSHCPSNTMKNITFAADESLIAAAREQAASENSSLNEQFRLWLEQYARKRQTARAMQTISRLQKKYDTGGQKFSREEMNER